jgi:hypothetical protein
MSTRDTIRAAQAEAAVAFGAMLRTWREANGWTQYTAAEWAAQARPPFDAMPHSGLSELENGKTKHPRTPLFLYLGELNARVAAGDYKGVSTRKVIDALKGSRPITHPDGTPWTAPDFWSCYAGLLPVVDWLQPRPLTPAPEITLTAACDLGDGWREQVLRIGSAAGLRPLAAVGQFIRTCPASAREALEDGFAGGFTVELVASCWDPEAGEWGPTAWIADWAQALAGRSAAQSGGGDGRSSEPVACQSY